jgi:uncharacterized glyoxalase superfamily protein PhnB
VTVTESTETGTKPEGYAWVIPFLFVEDVDAALDFYEGVLEFERAHLNVQDGAIVHAELRYRGRTVAMVAPAAGPRPPAAEPRTTAEILVYVDDVNGRYERAIAKGGKGVGPPTDHPWGERIGHVHDLDGYRWLLAESVAAP